MINEIITGVDRCVIYPMTAPAVTWNGVVSIKEATQSAGVEELYFDGRKYSNSFTRTGVNVSIEAFTYPDELDSEKPVRLRGMTWRNQTHNSHETHILYNIMLRQDGLDRNTIDDDTQLTLFSWEGISKPAFSTSLVATSHVILVAERTSEGVSDLIENLLYGTDLTPPVLPTLDEIVSIFEQQTVFIVIDHGDGTWTAIGPDDWVELTSATEFLIRTPSAYFLTDDKYKVRSW